MKINFLGAAESVTGSLYLISTSHGQILLDCGMFQGSKVLDRKNREEFPFDPSQIKYMILSHSHIDHSGRIPLLVKRGFRGKIFCTDATADLVSIMLQDSGYIQEKEAEWQTRKGQRTGAQAVDPLYTFADAVASLEYLHPVLYDQIITIEEGLVLRFSDAGHILGSSIVELWVTEEGKTQKLVFSGDLGMRNRPILRDPAYIKQADFLIMETTYGDRVHENHDASMDKLIQTVIRTAKRGGTVIIPSFAVGRTQELIYEFNRYYEEHNEYKKDLDRIMVYVDSPLATSATEIFRRNAQVFDEETRAYIMKGDNPLDFKNLRFTRSSEESRILNHSPEPKIVISASGMCEAGRVKHHLKHHLWDKRSTVVFVGYQAEGTLGRSLVNGDKDVSIFGERIHVEAEIVNLEGFSGHADREDLLDWLSAFEEKPDRIFLVHGERESKVSFAYTIKAALGYDSVVIDQVQEYDLSTDIPSTDLVQAEQCVSKEEKLLFREKLAAVHEDIEQILYHTKLIVEDGIKADKMREINNILLELEKSTINLGAAVTEQGELCP